MKMILMTLGVIGGALFGVSVVETQAAPISTHRPAPVEASSPLVEQVVVRRRTVVRRGPAGGVTVRSRTVVRPGPVARPWVRPAYYRWRPGGAIAAGAAIGFVAGAAAVSWAATPAPVPGYCWYYTDASKKQGFWDACP